MTSGENILVGDVGGTHVRLAWAIGGIISGSQTLYTSKFRSLEEAIHSFLREQKHEQVDSAAFAVAGPVTNGRVQMINLDWQMDERVLAQTLGAKRVRLVNDFAAAALGIPHLKESELVQIGGGRPRDDAPKAIIGPGTGLGIGGLVPDGHGGFIPLPGEGGHSDLTASNARELVVLAHLLKGHDHVSAERVLSGTGLENLYRILAVLDGDEPARKLTASEIDAAARAGEARAKETVALFTGWLGGIAGNVALILGARGGVYLGGGILPRWGTLFDAKLFRSRFENKERMKEYLAPIPVFLVMADDLALRGLAALARVD